MEVGPEELARFFEVVLPHLNERQRRVVAGAASEMLGRGGKSAVAVASGMSRNTVIKAEREVASGIEPSERLRALGGGDRPLIDKQPGLVEALDEIVHPDTRGNPMSLLRWTSKSTRHLADALVAKGFKVSDDTVGRILKSLGYSLQAPAKEKEGTAHPDRDAQFSYLNEQATAFVNDDQPVISVDTKKKELVGEFKNTGTEWHPTGEPTRVRTHDFVDKKLGRAVPYGVYDLANDEGWVSVGNRADTAEFAVETIRRWWYSMGRPRFPDASRLLITADAGGSNGYRVRAWKKELARLAEETGLEITVCHYPPGTSKWNKIVAPHVQLHLDELAWTATRVLPDHRRADRRHHDEEGTAHPRRTGRGLLRDGGQDLRQGARCPAPHPARVPRRLELHAHPEDCSLKRAVSP